MIIKNKLNRLLIIMGITKIFLQEIGESGFSYNFRKLNEMEDEDSFIIEYEFDTPENKYTVYFEKYSDESLIEVGFNSKRGAKKIVKPTDEHVTLKVMGTVMNIAKKFRREYSQYKTFRIKFPWFDKLNSAKRERVYRLFIKKYFPEVKIKKVFRDLIVQI